jgi:molybdenum cofactor cytidylyltransferase
MMFGACPTETAAGAILAHTTRLPRRVLHKGTVLQPADLAALRDAGHATVVVARLDPGDVPEDEAAHALATALLVPGVSLRMPGTGRANLVADRPGLFRADAAGVDALNFIDDGLTLGTLPDASCVAPAEILATIKIIPFAVPGATLAAAVSCAAAAPPFRLALFRPLRAGLVLTELPGLKPSILAGTIEATRTRIARLTGTLLPPVTCPHDTASIAAGLTGLMKRGAELLLIAGASAVVDRLDVAPSAIVMSGGSILHLGMPVDPGNLLCLGQIGPVPAVILPGCARSPKLNGIDFVLARLFADEPVGAAEIRRMGTGGLLKDFAPRPAPRQGRARLG